MGTLEYRVNWSGTAVTGPGTSVFHGRIATASTAGAAAQDFADRVRLFFGEVRGLIPTGVSWDFPGEVTELDTTTGVLEDVHAITPPSATTSSGAAGNHSRPSGARIDWLTSSITAGRRLRGRTFLVPLYSAGYDTTGTIASTTLTTLNTAAANYIDAGVFADCQPAVWSRTHGVLADIVSKSITDRATVLRSRRD